MKKAILDQLFLGFLLLMGIVTFVATVNDETSTRNYIYDLKTLTKSSAKAMARYYEDNIDMCTAQSVTNAILDQHKLGLDARNNGLLSHKWWDSDGDGEPDKVTTTIAQHPHDTFWYRFFDKDDFTVGPFSWTEDVKTPVTVQLSFESEDAGYNNMMGIYQLDSNNCVTNAQLLLQNSNAGIASGSSIGLPFTSPPTFVFIISDGYDVFQNGDRPKVTDTITVNNHCFDNATSNPSVTLNGKTVNNTQMYFEHTQLNGDGGYEHIQLIPKNVQAQYEAFIGGTNANEKYQLFLAHCESVNNDNDSTNDIPSVGYVEGENDCTNDGNDQYLYAMEDLDGGGDQDFNDLMLNSTREVIPNQLNTYTVNNDSSINLICNNNAVPTVSLDCHDPNSVDENSSKTFDIINSVADSDGTIASIVASANNGTVILNNPSIIYTPDNDFNGQDTITITVTDDEGASNFASCSITVNEINNPPVINGNPLSSIEAGNIYTFIPSASDSDGDTLTFSISNKPSWASFDSLTGQLFGAPTNSNVGTYSNIVISVSDGVNSTSLSPFSITVTQNTSNNPPECSAILNQTAIETKQFSINLDNYCSDSDGDEVSYTYNILAYNGSTDNTINTTIPEGTASPNPYIVTVVASDGTDATSTSFALTITANAECNGPFEVNFNNNEDSFAGGNRSGGSYKINGGQTASRVFDFGSGCSNETVTVSYTYKTTNNWEKNQGDKFRIYSNSTREAAHNETPSWKTRSFSTTTNTNGKITLDFSAETNRNNEVVWIDDIILSSD